MSQISKKKLIKVLKGDLGRTNNDKTITPGSTFKTRDAGRVVERIQTNGRGNNLLGTIND